jgi:hypothetical protein
LNKFKQLFPDSIAWDSLLIYGGEVEQQRAETKVIRIFSLADFLKDL